jgi:hypothetical protein
LGRVSVVIMPRAAVTTASASVPKRPATISMPALIFPSGRNSPMMPVESTSTPASGTASDSGRGAAAIAAASSRPRVPVQALALPELIATARKPVPGVRARSKATGAANTRFVV